MRKPTRVSISAAVRSKAGKLASSSRGLGARGRMLQWISSGAGELRADLAHPIAEGDHVVEALVGEPAEVLARPPEMSMPRSAITRTALGCSGLGGCPPAAATAPPEQLLGRRLGDLERALLPVHRNSTRGAAPRRRGVGRRGLGGRMQRGVGARQQLAAACEIEDVVAVAAVGGAAPHRDQATVAQLAEVVGDQALGLAARLESSLTRRSLRASSLSSCHRSGCPASRRTGRRARQCAVAYARDNTSIFFDFL